MMIAPSSYSSEPLFAQPVTVRRLLLVTLPNGSLAPVVPVEQPADRSDRSRV